MKNANWSLAHNTFATVMQRSFALTNVVSTDHHDKLLGLSNDPEIDLIYADFEPVHTAFNELYTSWKDKQFEARSATQRVYELLTDLSSKKIERFDVLIQVSFAKDTVEYNRLLADGRNPFQKGGIDNRIASLKALLKGIDTITGLSDLQNEVQDFYDRLLEARSVQQGLEGQVGDLRDQMEMKRIDLAAAMLISYGRLLAKFSREPWMIEKFFDLENIQSKQSGSSPPEVLVSLSVNPGSTVESGLIMEPEVMYTISNQGNTTLRLWLSGESGSDYSGQPEVLIDPRSTKQMTAVELGMAAGGFLNVTNLSTTVRGEIEVSVE